ncbi:hypothetical protein [Sanguibacter sp. Z1732]|uniref:hypothetical protein n=1 Tax=Sanguibacter sp. Z1732 TaxID=3435412 RepID=UPI003D9CB6E9
MSTSMMAAASGGPFLAIGSNGDGSSIGLLFFLSGFLFYGLMYLRYRNVDKRHMHARETEAEIDNVRAADDFVGRRTPGSATGASPVRTNDTSRAPRTAVWGPPGSSTVPPATQCVTS